MTNMEKIITKIEKYRAEGWTQTSFFNSPEGNHRAKMERGKDKNKEIIILEVEDDN